MGLRHDSKSPLACSLQQEFGRTPSHSKSRQHSSLLTNQKQVNNKEWRHARLETEIYTYHELFQGLLEELIVHTHTTGVLGRGEGVLHD